jgi:hypothetical protein
MAKLLGPGRIGRPAGAAGEARRATALIAPHQLGLCDIDRKPSRLICFDFNQTSDLPTVLVVVRSK